jgi:hypothetical protein
MCFGGGKKAARIEAEATMAAANMQASSDRQMVQATQNTTETMLAQQVASQKAAELLDRPQQQVEVKLGSSTEAATIDPTTNRRSTTRSRYTRAASKSGLSI